MNDTAKVFLLAVAVALIVTLGLAVWLIGAETLRTVALILFSALALGLILAASAFPIRAWKRKDMTGETHHYHDGTKTVVQETRILDGRQMTAPEVKLFQLPTQPMGGAFPELLRAAYQAGALTDGRGRASYPAAAETPRELPAVDLAGEADGWTGPVYP